MNFLEKDLERIIFEADKGLLHEKGLCLPGQIKRQLRIGNYGIADLITMERPRKIFDNWEHHKGVITIVELKKDRISMSSLLQAVGYLRGVQRYLELKKPNLSKCFNYRLVIVGNTMDWDSEFAFLPSIFENDLGNSSIGEFSLCNIEFYKYDYDFDGISFQEIKSDKILKEGF